MSTSQPGNKSPRIFAGISKYNRVGQQVVEAIVPHVDFPSPDIPPGWDEFSWSSVYDTYKDGFCATVNTAMSKSHSIWTLIWNSDATPSFDAKQMASALKDLDEDVVIAAPCKVPHADALKVSGPEPRAGLIHAWAVVTDSGPLWVRIDPETVPPGIECEVYGTAYSPLYAVRTKWFLEVGGLPMIYNPGYYDDAHMWRLARRLGFKTVILPWLTYEHEGEATFKKVYGQAELRRWQARNLCIYHALWEGREFLAPLPWRPRDKEESPNPSEDQS